MPETPSGRWYSFAELTALQVYEILALRQSVFIVEQASIYPDIDFADQTADHLLVTAGPTGEAPGELIAYARCLPPAADGSVAFGRIVVAPAGRGLGLGRRLVADALARLEHTHPDADVVIGAQAHLQRFYGAFGFVGEGEPYDDGGIEHVHMRLVRSRVRPDGKAAHAA